MMGELLPDRLTRADVARLLPVDNRLSARTIELAAAVAADLNETLERTGGGFALPDEAWKMFVLYFGGANLRCFFWLHNA